MNSASSAGTSINFDGQALHEQDEAEYQREEQEQEKVLRDLLAAQLGDLSDDDDSQSSQAEESDEIGDEMNSMANAQRAQTGMHNNMMPMHDASPYLRPQQGPPPSQDEMFPAQTTPSATPYPPTSAITTPSTMMFSAGSVLTTPAATPYPELYNAEHPNQPLDYRPNEENQNNIQTRVSETTDIPFINGREAPVHGVWMQRPTEFVQRGETEGGNEYGQHYVHAQEAYNAVPHGGYYDSYVGDEPRGTGTHIVDDHLHGANGHDNIQYEATETQKLGNPQGYQAQRQPDGYTQRPQPIVEYRRSDEGIGLDNYKVTYNPVPAAVSDATSTDHLTEGAVRVKDNEVDAVQDTLQQAFLKTDSGSSVEAHQLQQLQVLYDARGHKIADVMGEFSVYKDTTEREMRGLQHKCTMLQDERDGAVMSHKESQQLLQTERDRIVELERSLATHQAQLAATMGSKDQVMKQLHGAESSIEALNLQLGELQASETLSRAREQHDHIVSGLQQRHEQQLLILNEKLEQQDTTLREKADEINSLKNTISNLHKANENSQLQRADLVNQLTQRLDDSQKHCQTLLEQGTIQETSSLKLKLQEAIASRSITEDMNVAMQDEIKDLKEHISMMESVSNCSALTHDSIAPSPIPFNAEDSYSHLGIKKNLGQEFSTPVANSSSTEKVIQTLRSELERCLVIYRNKRTQSTKLQEDLKSTRVMLEAQKHTVEKLNKENKSMKEKVTKLEELCGDLDGNGEARTVREAQLLKQQNKLTEQNSLLKHNIQEVESRLDEVCISEEKLKELNRALQSQMSELVREYDDDKQQALQKVRSVCEQHYEDSKQKWMSEYKETLEQGKLKTVSEYEEKLNTASENLTSVKSELDTVKEMYVEMSASLGKQEEELNQEWQKKLDAFSEQLKSELELEKSHALESLRHELVSEHQTILCGTKDEMKKYHDQEVDRRLEAELVLAKARWFQEYQSSKESAIQSAVVCVERKWEHKVQQKITEQLKKQLFHVSNDSENNNTIDHNTSDLDLNLEQLQLARETWKSYELKDELDKAKALWIKSDLQVELENAKALWMKTDLKIELSKAKEIWVKKDLPPHINKAKEDWISTELQQHLSDAKQLWIKTELDPIIQNCNIRRKASSTTDSAVSMDDTLIRDTVHSGGRISEAVESAQTEWSVTQQKNLNLAVQQAKDEAIGDASQKLQIELTSLRAMKTKLEEKIAKQAQVMQQQKSKWNEEKSLELQKAVDAVRLQCDEDYKAFLIDHEESLETAVNELKTKYQLEKQSILKQHSSEIEALQHRIQTTITLEEQIQQMKHTVDAHWQKELQIAQTQHAKEREAMIQQHEDDLEIELKQAKIQWIQENEHQLSTCTQCTKLCSQLNTAQQQYTTAAECMSTQRQQITECKQQQQDQQASYEREVHLLKEQVLSVEAQLKDKPTLTSRVNELVHNSRETQIQIERLNNENEVLKSQVTTLSADKQNLSAEIHRLTSTKQNLMDQLQAYEEELQNLRQQHYQAVERVQQGELEMVELRKNLHEAESMTRDREHDGSNLLQQLHQYKQQLHGLDEQLLTVQDEAVQKSKRADKKLKALDAVYRKKMEQLRESLTAEHDLAMEKMKVKMVELRQSHLIVLEEARREHEDMIERVCTERRTDIRTCDVQTDEEMTCYEGLTEMKAFYVRALDKMRSDLLTHVSDSNKRAADTVHAEVMRERKSTARRLQKYYMRCLAQVLHQKNQWLTYHEKMAYIERALQNVPDRDSSSPGTTDESSSSTPATPVTNTVLNHNQQTSTQHYNSNSGTPQNTTHAAFSPYSTSSRSRKGTPVELHDAPTLSTIGTAPSTPRSATYTKTRHHFSVAPEIVTTVEDPKMIMPEQGCVSLAPTTAHIADIKTTIRTPDKPTRHQRNRQRGHSAEVSVDSLLGQAQALSLFKSSSLENVANAPGSRVTATTHTNMDRSFNQPPVMAEQKYYNLDLDLDVLVQPHLRAVTACAAQPVSTAYHPLDLGRNVGHRGLEHNVGHREEYNLGHRGLEPSVTLQQYSQPISTNVESRLTNPDTLYSDAMTRDKNKHGKHRRTNSRTKSLQATPTLTPTRNQSISIAQEQLGIASIAATTTHNVNYDHNPMNHVTKRRSRSTDRAYTRDTTEFQPLSLTLFSPTVQSSNQVDRRYQEGYPSSTTSSIANSQQQSPLSKILMQSPTMFSRATRRQKSVTDSSDTESIGSLGSGSSVSDFRQALRINHAGSTPPPLSQRLHLYPSSHTVATSATVERLHKPVAMVTRQTQAPTHAVVTKSATSKHSRSKTTRK